jgi:peptidoglycan/LPS O-acetylase OafA/YrhL
VNNTSTNIAKFDVLRGISIILVFSYHSFICVGLLGKLPINFPRTDYFIDFEILNLTQWFVLCSPLFYGGGGVQIFLLISGFLIHYSFLKGNEPKLNIGTFFSRRFWRIYPPYLLALLVFILCTNSYSNVFRFPMINYIWSHLTMTHNLWDDHFFQINSSFWSLALECQLYLIYPLVLWLRGKFSIKTVLYISIIVYGLAVFIEFFYIKNSIAWSLSLPKSWVIWVLGAFLAERFKNQNPIFKKINNAILLLLIVLFILLMWSNISQYFFHFFVAVLGAILIEKYLYRPVKSLNLFEKMLTTIGLCSYSMYLFHQPLLEPLYKMISVLGLSNKSGAFVLVDMGIIFSIVFCLSYTLYLFIELPSVDFGKKRLNLKRGR